MLSFADVKVKIDPHAGVGADVPRSVAHRALLLLRSVTLHGTNTAEDEKRFEPYVESIASRADLNYIFQEMLGAFSVGHLRGNGGAIPEAKRVPGGLLGADYKIDNNRYCIAKIYTGGDFNPHDEGAAGAARPQRHPSATASSPSTARKSTAATDIQQALEGTAGQVISIRIGIG